MLPLTAGRWCCGGSSLVPLIETLPDGSYVSVLVSPKATGRARDRAIEAAKAGKELDPGKVRLVRVNEYAVSDRNGGNGELTRLISTITDPVKAPAAVLAQGYHERWEHETGNKQLKNRLRGPGRCCGPRARTWRARRSTRS